ncbi:MAG: enoyl-CoA hydratase/isomerase family protein [Betaproteobacteria bacterium]|jgi:enoyl-CoA hydratase/carnithine racemase|nr:enoyl-CoA hydratase/isomerase family protein [Betaproteobacteria bacterium]
MADAVARIRSERSGDLARVVIDNPGRANALGSALLEALRATFESFAADPPRAVVLTGAGDRAFAGGADLAELGALDVDSGRRFITKVHEACDAVRRCPAPVIARVRGYALGAGLELAASCDIRVASEDAMFGMPEVRFGIPSVVEAALLPRMLGRGRAAWFLLTGRNIDARTALDWGLVECVVPAEALDAEVNATLAAIGEMDPQAVREQKRLLAFWDERPLSEGIAESIEALAQSYRDGVPNRLIEGFLAARKRR